MTKITDERIEQCMNITENQLQKVIAKFETGVNITSQHDLTENKWCVGTNHGLRFYGTSLDKAISNALNFDGKLDLKW